jgi:hypothetical protein
VAKIAPLDERLSAHAMVSTVHVKEVSYPLGLAGFTPVSLVQRLKTKNNQRT